MRDELQTFLERPTAQNYRRVRCAVLDGADGVAEMADFDEMDRLCRERRFRQVRQMVDALLPDWSLSPKVHFFAAWAARELGDAEDAELEAFLHETCLQGLLATGDGSRRRPYLVTHVPDEYDVLKACRRDPCSQTLVETGSRRFDVVTCHDGSEIWFDVTDLVGAVGSQTSRKPLSKVV